MPGYTQQLHLAGGDGAEEDGVGEEPCSSAQPYLSAICFEAYGSVILVEQQMFRCCFALTKLPASYLHLLDC